MHDFDCYDKKWRLYTWYILSPRPKDFKSVNPTFQNGGDKIGFILAGGLGDSFGTFFHSLYKKSFLSSNN